MVKIQTNSQGKAYLTTGGKALAAPDNEKYDCTIDNLLGDVNVNGVLQLPADTSGDIVFSGVKDIATKGLAFKFYQSDYFTKGVSFPDLETVSGTDALREAFNGSGITSVSLSKLVTVSGNNAMRSTFYNCPITSISIQKLTTISGQYGCNYMLYGVLIASISMQELTTISGQYGASSMFAHCPNLVTASLPKLANIKVSSACSSMFSGSTAIEHIYFNALTTTSFGGYKNQFSNMMQSTGTNVTHTIHFPSNLQSKVSTLTGYPLFGGTSDYVVLAFDLDPTE